MIVGRKTHFVAELKRHYSERIADARKAEVAAAEGAEAIQREARSREDAKGAMAEARMAAGHQGRRERTAEELEALIQFAAGGLRPFRADERVALGALVDVSIDTDGEEEERTLFLLPVGAGTELSGPGGDGFVSVVTPSSVVGRALQGALAGDSFEVVTGGLEREWTVVDVC
jgi:transcription elongation GreA/GreB family factor